MNRQVPAPRHRGSPREPSSLRYGLIGDGRLARHLARYFTLARIPFRAWSRRSEQDLQATLGDCDVFLVAIRDDAVEPFIWEQLAPRFPGRARVHFSGALQTPLAWSFHPLASFGPAPYDLEFYLRVPFMAEEGAPGFSELFPRLANPSHVLRAELRPLYHALCVLAGNFSTLLWQKLFTDFESALGLPADTARPYLESVFLGLQARPGAALTGPLARRDFRTIEANLAALQRDPYARVYRAFVEAHLPETLPVPGLQRAVRAAAAAAAERKRG
jgi:2-dehydropantoate 2-reductase